MTNNPSNQPFEPFRVQSDLLKNAAAQSGRVQPAGGDPGKPGKPGSRKVFGDWDLSDARWLVMIVFGFIYWLSERDAFLRPLTIVVLLACLLFRMEPRARQFAGVPLVLAAIKLAYQMTPNSLLPGSTLSMLPEQTKDAIGGLPWVPMFLAICIFYLPKNANVTATIMRVAAIALLISGLIPGDGYIVILAMIQYTLFIGVLVGLIADHAWNGGETRMRVQVN